MAYKKRARAKAAIPTSSMADVAQANYPFVPVRLLLKYEYRATDYVKRVRAPVTVIHSRDDEIVPFDLGLGLFAEALDPKRILLVSGGHNYYPETPWADILGLDAPVPEGD